MPPYKDQCLIVFQLNFPNVDLIRAYHDNVELFPRPFIWDIMLKAAPCIAEGIDRIHVPGQDWLQILPVIGALSLLSYVTYQAFRSKPVPKDQRVNLKIQKECSKVVNMVDIEELGDKVSYCRCWRSKKFPICDGSHNKHNEESGDNVGPLVLKRKEPLASK